MKRHEQEPHGKCYATWYVRIRIRIRNPLMEIKGNLFVAAATECYKNKSNSKIDNKIKKERKGRVDINNQEVHRNTLNMSKILDCKVLWCVWTSSAWPWGKCTPRKCGLFFRGLVDFIVSLDAAVRGHLSFFKLKCQTLVFSRFLNFFYFLFFFFCCCSSCHFWQ